MTEDKTTVLQWLEHHFSVIFIKTPTQNIKIPHHNNNYQNKKRKPNQPNKKNKTNPTQNKNENKKQPTQQQQPKKTPTNPNQTKNPTPQTPEIYILSWCKAPQQSDIGQVWPQEFQVTPAEQVQKSAFQSTHHISNDVLVMWIKLLMTFFITRTTETSGILKLKIQYLNR